ncbi:MAG: ribulose-phosphate 3-epimerase [Bdellovibrionaceae bacterium]|nr:ribulose-phosphate 3-epimerase [Pseudobdellovibrionaceae bacterium]|tara:strand:+ start:513 stop:1220 length:708 start_codon:yes stop_codon:yes gene_type:complete
MNKESGVKLTASIMCVNWLQVKQDLDEITKEGIDSFHWDLIDGNFASDFTMGSSVIDPIRKAYPQIPGDFHLMVEEPSRLFDAFPIQEGDVVSIHQEACRNLHRDLVTMRRKGWRPGVAISPGTPLETLEYIIEDADVVLIMTVNPGYKGQQIVPQVFRKIEKLKSMIENLKIPTEIHVDGNVNPQTAVDLVAAGADVLVCGSSGLFRKDIGLSQALKEMRRSASEGLKRRSHAV